MTKHALLLLCPLLGAVVEVFAAGEFGVPGARPLFVEKAHPDATPVHAGVGEQTRCDVRVTIPGGKVVERSALEAGRTLIVAP